MTLKQFKHDLKTETAVRIARLLSLHQNSKTLLPLIKAEARHRAKLEARQEFLNPSIHGKAKRKAKRKAERGGQTKGA
jgi:hypothetical protein